MLKMNVVLSRLSLGNSRYSVGFFCSRLWIVQSLSGSKRFSSDNPEPSTEPPNPDEGGIDGDVILSAALNYVPDYGWSQKAIQLALTAQGLPASAHTLFKRGPGNLIEHFELKCDEELLQYMRNLKIGDNPVNGPPLIQKAVRQRLQMLIPYIKRWPEAMAIKAYPDNLPYSLERLALMVDEIWYQAGDQSTDFNWYTKRGILAGVYCSTELYMVQDNSVNFEDTWVFLQRRFEDTKTITDVRKQFSGVLDGTIELSSAGITTVRNVLGINSWNR